MLKTIFTNTESDNSPKTSKEYYEEIELYLYD